MNANNALGDFIRGKPFVPRPLVNTRSPALDVSIPSNLSRLASFYRESPSVMRNMVFPASIDDDSTVQTIEDVWKNYGLRIDSNTAVAVAAAEQTAAIQGWKGNSHTVILATGHYAREAELFRRVTGEAVPAMFQSLQKEVKPVAVIPPDIDAFEGVIANCF
jgi:threonine synthase